MKNCEILNGFIVKAYNFLMKRNWINKNSYYPRKVRFILQNHICYECMTTFGKYNPDKLFYVIRCPIGEIGFFGLFNFVVYHLKLAEDMGAIPVVDLKYYYNDYICEDYNIGKINSWDLFFRQTIDIDEVYRSKNVFMSNGKFSPSQAEVDDKMALSKSGLLIDRYLQPQNEILKACKQKLHDLNMENKKVLGVKCRGTDFAKTKPSKHQIVPDVYQTIKVIEEKEKEWGRFDSIFVATEDKDMFDTLLQHYGSRMVYVETDLIGNIDGKWLNELFRKNELRGHKFNRMADYYISIWLLAHCDSLIAPVVGGTLGAMRMRGGEYRHVYLFHLGAYD